MAGLGKRMSNAFRCFVSVLGGGPLPPDLASELIPAPAPAPGATLVDPADRAVQLLALLQRDARFVDFVTEDVSRYSDEQVGAAARAVHAGCRQVLERYFTLAPVLPGDEGTIVSVESADPAEVKVIGNARPGASARGTLQHRGWRAAASSLPPLPDGRARSVVAPAEVEIG